MNLTITDAARAKISELQATRSTGAAVRIGLRAGGCKGFEQLIELDPVITDSDTTFDIDGIFIVIDKKSVVLMPTLKLDWTGDLLGKRFVFILPESKNSCSCGSSFNI
jgi:iron-sulfur cluster assembly protein